MTDVQEFPGRAKVTARTATAATKADAAPKATARAKVSAMRPVQVWLVIPIFRPRGFHAGGSFACVQFWYWSSQSG